MLRQSLMKGLSIEGYGHVHDCGHSLMWPLPNKHLLLRVLIHSRWHPSRSASPTRPSSLRGELHQ